MVSDPNPNPVHLPAYDSVEDMDRRAVPVSKAADEATDDAPTYGPKVRRCSCGTTLLSGEHQPVTARQKLALQGRQYMAASRRLARAGRRLDEAMAEAQRLVSARSQADATAHMANAADWADQLVEKYHELAREAAAAGAAARVLLALDTEARTGG